MNEQEWLECTDPQQMLLFLWGKATNRKLRLLAVACCRQVWPQLNVPLLRRAVEVGEKFADGMAEESELVAARHELAPHGYVAGSDAIAAAYGAVGPVPVVWAPEMAARLAHAEVARQALERGERHIPPDTKKSIRQAQADLLRCVIRPFPFRPASIDPAWRTPRVVALAQSIYEERTFDRLPILADSLEAAGCTNPDILGHCRGPGPHARSCWVVDGILGKN